jgi:hypothetical protein
MSYRPQFAYLPPPPGVREEAFHYSFDSANSDALKLPVAANNQSNNIPLQFERDAEFRIRAILVTSPKDGGGLQPSTLQLWLKDPWGNYLMDHPIELNTCWSGTGIDEAGRNPVLLEPEIICPAGSQVVVYLTNIRGTQQDAPIFTLFGVKRYYKAVN